MTAKAKKKVKIVQDEWKKFEDECDKKHAFLDAIFLVFDKNIKYDYPIPDYYHIEARIRACLDIVDVPKTFKGQLKEIYWEAYDSYSDVHDYLTHKTKFGSEWFYGYGTLYRWRPGEREKAQARVEKHLTTRQKNYFAKLEKKLKLRNRKLIKAFKMAEAMEKV